VILANGPSAYVHQPLSHSVSVAGPSSQAPVVAHPQLGGKTIFATPTASKHSDGTDSDESGLTEPDAEGEEESDAEGEPDDADSDASMGDNVKQNGNTSVKRSTNRVESEETGLDEELWGLRRSVSSAQLGCRR
jgi:hypothetical protein